METEPNILARAFLSIGEAQLIEWCWPSPMDVIAREDRHMIEMSLPPLATDGSACFPEIDPDRSSFMGSLFFRPAGVLLRARSAGGRNQVMRIAVEPRLYSAIVGGKIDYGEEALRAGLDLRNEVARQLLANIRRELLEPGARSGRLLDLYAEALVIEVARAISSRSRRRRQLARLTDWQYRRVRDRIEQDGKPPTLSELSDLAGVSERHFTRLYRALTGEAPSARIRRVRLERAKRLLEGSALPIKAIAAQTGFAHPTTFSNAFREALGMGPDAFRRSRLEVSDRSSGKDDATIKAKA